MANLISDFCRFARAVISRWQAYVTGSLFTAIAFIYEHVTKRMISENVVLWGIAGFFLAGAFMAWREQAMNAQKLQDAADKDFEDTYYSIVSWIIQGHYPLYALQAHNVDEFRSNDDVIRLCDRLVSDKHRHPFDVISTVIPKSDWLQFLRWARGRGITFYREADTYKWATELLKERGGRPMVEIMKEGQSLRRDSKPDR